MKKKLLALIVIALAVSATISVTALAANSQTKISAATYHDEWRKLWEDHVWWTRIVIIGVFDNSSGIDVYVQRLLQNVPDMINALKPFYGSRTDELSALLTSHLTIAYQILLAAKAGQNITSLLNQWYQNANDIATYMHQLNPQNWPLEMMQSMWKQHLDVTLQEAVDHLTGNYTAEVAVFEQVHTLALQMADFISSGPVLQFPSKFTGNGFVR